MKLLVRGLLALVLAYAALVGALWASQRSMLFLPDGQVVEPGSVGLAMTVVTRETSDGERLRMWFSAPKSGHPLVIHFHGNGGNQSLWAGVFRDLMAAGYGVLSVSYRGYGGSTGRPSEAGLIEDARAAYEAAGELAPGHRIVLFGDSLGTGVATALGSQARIAGLVLNAPFLSVEDLAAETYWFIPVRLLLSDRFLTRERIRGVDAPLLILHGDRDRVVPVSHGERLHGLAREPKRFIRIANGGHTNLWRLGAREEVLAFLVAIREAPMIGRVPDRIPAGSTFSVAMANALTRVGAR